MYAIARNPEKPVSVTSQGLLYLISLLSGSAGGAGAAGWHVLNGRGAKRAMIISYVVVGGAVGLFVDAWVLIYAQVIADNGNIVHHLVMLGVGSGFTAATGLAALQKLTSIALKWRGINVEIKFSNKREGNDGNQF